MSKAPDARIPEAFRFPGQRVVRANAHALFLMRPEEVLIGSGLIVPRERRETVFDLTAEEWAATRALLHEARAYLEERYRPDGYTVGWNAGPVAGQTIPHAHLHVIPRYADEPYAGRGLRHWIKQPENRRVGAGAPAAGGGPAPDQVPEKPPSG